MKQVSLIEPSKNYKYQFIQYVQDYKENGEKEYFDMYKGSTEDFDAYVDNLINNAKGLGLPEGWVPCSTYWLVDNNNILGIIRIRHELNSGFLRNIGGHIGYDIAPSKRKNGFGKLILNLGLEKAKAMNISCALLTCKSDNYGSAKIIEANGGIFDSEILDSESGNYFKRYWIKL